MTKPKIIKEKFVDATEDMDADTECFEYFIRYDAGGANQDSIQGIVVRAPSACIAVAVVSEELPYFKLLNMRKL